MDLYYHIYQIALPNFREEDSSLDFSAAFPTWFNGWFSVAERLSESIHIVDHDPSLALYRLQEHIGKSLPVLNNRKYTVLEVNTALQGACYDLDNIIRAIQSMEEASRRFFTVKNFLRSCEEYERKLDLGNE
ncbi:unnamed protein product [Enterobius vermicularis]|uniref:Uncharacterized protein n=1 Tax=Enterobius vermicularis TaxID=51028 RepID=A0A0N4V4H4_ENTVE|nr:unnamed protein product [Enterobius vermicularis]